MDSAASTFDERIATREAKVGIVGLGYAGLPLAMAFAEAGFEVIGIDYRRDRVDAVDARRSYLVDVPAARYADARRPAHATTDYAAVRELDALTICVPTPLSKTRSPDMSYIVAAAESIAEHLRPGQLVVLQSTTYPGTTEEVVQPILERTGGVVGVDFFLGYAPERVDPGNAQLHDQEHAEARRRRDRGVPRAGPSCSTARSSTTVVPISSTMVAETAKLHENTFRAVNIALANELALMCDRLGISAWEVIDAASTQAVRVPARTTRAPASAATASRSCRTSSPARLREYGYSPRLIDAAHEINAQMPGFVVRQGRRRAERGRASRSRARGSCSSAWPTRRTSTTRASRRASRSCASFSSRGGDVVYATRGSARSTSRASRTRRRLDARRRSSARTASSS